MRSWKLGARRSYPICKIPGEADLRILRALRRVLDTAERDLKVGHEEMTRTGDEFVKILK